MRGPLTLAQIAAQLGGRVVGDAQTRVAQVASLEAARDGQISFLGSGKHKPRLEKTRASAVILAAENERLTELPRIVCDNPYAYFARLSQLLNGTTRQAAGVHPTAVVSDKAVLGKGVSIGAGCVVGEGVSIGEDSCLYPRVVVYAGCTLGRRVIVHAGVVIGADGFGFAPEGETLVKIPQIGGVRIGDDVEIGANSTVDRGALDDTVIEEGVKIDNLVQVGHNVRIGAHSAIAACAGIAGSTVIGRQCLIGGAAMIGGHLRIADHVEIVGGTAVGTSIEEPGAYAGALLYDKKVTWARNAVLLKRIGDLSGRVRALEGKGKKNG